MADSGLREPQEGKTDLSSTEGAAVGNQGCAERENL